MPESAKDDGDVDREECVACGKMVGATVTEMLAHWTLECPNAEEYGWQAA
jgi:hypothetical protein